MKENDNNSKLFYSISEVAEMFNVEQSLIRYWEREFSTFIQPVRTHSKRRCYRNEDIKHIKLIYHLTKEEGMTLSGAKHRLKLEKHNVEAEEEIFTKLKNIRNELKDLQDALTLPIDKKGYK